QYTPTKEKFEWDAERPWRKKDDLKELITLAKLTKVSNATRGKMQKLLERLPVNNDAYRKYQSLLKKHKDALEQLMLEAKPDQMYLIARGFEEMFNDKGDKPKDKDNVSLVEFWARPEMKDLREDILDFRRVSLYGDPLAVTSKYGKGNVVAFLT